MTHDKVMTATEAEAGICPERGDEIEIGDEVIEYGPGHWIHVDCYPDEEVSPLDLGP